MRKLVVACIVACCMDAAFGTPPPDRINYQGVLRNNLDHPLDGSFSMVFRFYTAAMAGDQILVDTHSAPASPVTVSVGLFAVQLGGGAVSDGTGPGIYTSLSDMFRDFGSIYLEVQIGAEILSPRIPILATPYSLAAATATTATTATTLASGMHGNTYTFSNPLNSFSGNGTGLTNVTAATLAAGTHSGAYTFSNPSNSFSGNGTGLTNVTAATLAAGTHVGAYTFSNSLNTFGGDGSGLSNVTAAGLSGGTYANPYTLSNAGNAFTGASFTGGTFSGNGSALTGVTAQTLAAGTHSGAYAFSNSLNSYTGDGSGLSNIAASGLAGGTYANAYTLSNSANAFTGASFGGGTFTGDGSGLLNVSADTLDGLDGGSLLRSDASDSYDSGTLTFMGGTTLNVQGAIHLNGELRMDEFGPEGSQTIYFFDASSPTGQRFEWNETGGRFIASSGLGAVGPIHAGISGMAGPPYNRFGGGTGSPDSTGIMAADDVYVESDLEIDGVLAAAGQIRVQDAGPDSTQGLLFYDDGAAGNEFIAWDDGDDRFELSNHVAVRDSLRVGSDTAPATSYSHFGPAGAPSASETSSSSDVYVSQELEVDGALILNGGLLMDDDGPDQTQLLSFYEDGVRDGEFLAWKDAADRFEVSDDFFAAGDIQASGAKTFVQNHPYRPDLSVVYAALEGDEVGTYTRGTARLVGGDTRVPLGETFAWTTNPGLGLTAYVTPRAHPVPLAVVSLTTSELVVRGPEDAPAGLVFDYVVIGLRVGFEEFPPVRDNVGDARPPAREEYLRRYASHPELSAYSAQSRHTRMREAAGSNEPLDQTGSLALQQAIGGGALGQAAPATWPGPTDGASGEPAALPYVLEAGPAIAPPATPANDVYARSFRPRASDLATLVEVSEPVEAGDVLVIDVERPGVMRPSRTAADAGVIGVVASTPGLVLGAQSPAAPEAEKTPSRHESDPAAGAAEDPMLVVPVAVSGIVLCKVDARYGAVRPGDLLTTAPRPGHAMRADDPAPGTILGKALESLDAGTGLVRILVTPR